MFNRVYFRPALETFAEFLIQVVVWTFDEEWWKKQNSSPRNDWHPLRQWWDAWAKFTRSTKASVVRTEYGTQFSGVPTGRALALVAFGYDLYTLQIGDRLPGYVVERLRQQKSFQASSYEIMVAAILARAGFSIEFLDPQEQVGKHCEFLAARPDLPTPIAVEVKSRVRSGAYEGTSKAYGNDVEGLLRLATAATKQGVCFPESPLLIFVDVNLPSTPDVLLHQKAWIADMDKVFDRLEGTTNQEATSWSMIVATNFGLQWENGQRPAPPVEVAVASSPRAKAPLPEFIRREIVDEVVRYGQIPIEI